MAEAEALTEVPPQLKKLVRLVIRAFYQPEQYVVMDILARYPCVNENDLLELLKLEQKKLRMIISTLRKDKLIKNVQKMETKILPNGDTKNYVAQYYYINYKMFVNVVKYKLDRMRERIQTQERTVRNSTSYICPDCQNTYTDLDVDRLIDPLEGVLRCFMCKTQLIEDTPEGGDMVDARSLLSRLNDQLKPVLDLLREVDNISLAPHMLDPEPQSIERIIQENKYNRNKQQQNKIWTTNKTDDIYGDQTFSIHIGNDSKRKTVHKDAPQWMKESTIYQDTASSEYTTANKETALSTTKATELHAKDEIMALLAHEQQKQKPANESSSSDGNTSSEEEEDTLAPKLTWQDETSNQTTNSLSSKVESNNSFDSDDEEDSSDDELTLNVGGKLYQLSDIGPDVVSQMTPEEKEKYTQLCQQAYSNFF